jgi:hypothetical protein
LVHQSKKGIHQHINIRQHNINPAKLSLSPESQQPTSSKEINIVVLAWFTNNGCMVIYSLLNQSKWNNLDKIYSHSTPYNLLEILPTR